jgi:hypothetical protein
MRHIGWLSIVVLAGWPGSVGAQINLAWKFQKGETLYLETVQVRKQSLEANGKSLTKKTETTTTVTALKVKETTARGTILDIRIEDRKFESDMSGDGSEAKLAAKLKGAVFTVTLNQAGKITKLAGYDDFIKKLADGNEDIEKQARSGLSEEVLKKSMEETFSSLPGRPVSRGDSWKIESTEPLGPFGAFKVVKTFTYDGKESDGELVTVTATRTYTPPSGEGALGVKVTKGKLQAEGVKESFVFDADKGRLVRGHNHVTIRGSLTVEVNDEPQTVEVLVDQTDRIRVLSTNPLAK